MFSLKLLKCVHCNAHNNLPIYFDVYRPQLEQLITPYSLRPHLLPVPQIHVYAESSLIYRLVEMKNNITMNDSLILQKLDESSHSYTGFSKYVTNHMLDKYSFQCVKNNVIPVDVNNVYDYVYVYIYILSLFNYIIISI